MVKTISKKIQTLNGFSSIKKSLKINNMFCTYKKKIKNYIKYNFFDLYFYNKYRKLRLPYERSNFYFFFVKNDLMKFKNLSLTKDKFVCSNQLVSDITNKNVSFFVLKNNYLKRKISSYKLQIKRKSFYELKVNKQDYKRVEKNIYFNKKIRKFLILKKYLINLNFLNELKKKFIKIWCQKILLLINNYFCSIKNFFNSKASNRFLEFTFKIFLKNLTLKLIFSKKLLYYYTRIFRKNQLLTKNLKKRQIRKFFNRTKIKKNLNLYKLLKVLKIKNKKLGKSFSYKSIFKRLSILTTKAKKKNFLNFYSFDLPKKNYHAIFSAFFYKNKNVKKRNHNNFFNKIILKKKLLFVKANVKKKLLSKNNFFFKNKVKINLKKYRRKKELFSLKSYNTNSSLKFFNTRLKNSLFVKNRRKILKIKRILRRLKKQRRLKRLFMFYKRGWLKKQVWILAKKNAFRINRKRQFFYGIYYLQIFYFLQILLRCGKKEKTLNVLFKMFNLIYITNQSSVIGFLKTSFIALQRIFGFYKKSYKLNKKGRARVFNIRTPYLSLTEYSLRNAANNFAKGIKKNSKTFFFERMLNELKVMKLKKGFAFNEGLVDFRGYKLKKLRKTYKSLKIGRAHV